MSGATRVEILYDKYKVYAASIRKLGTIRTNRDEARRALKDIESQIYFDKSNDGTIDGKNAETREAQTHIQYKLDPSWQAASSLFRNLESAFQLEQDEANLALLDLRVWATIVNADIAETGATKLLTEVNLAQV